MRLRKKFLQIPKVSKDYKPKISSSALAEVKENFEAYCSLILQSDLSPNSQSIYIESGDKFVRWLSGRFMPRSRKERVYALRNRSRPEAFPAPYFVDTGMFPATAAFLAGYEVYYRRRNWLFGSEYWFQKVSSPSTRNPLFNGGEFVATWVITGETRTYNTVGGFFRAIRPQRPVFSGGPGAWELVSRYTYINLDSGAITGGRFGRFTEQLNWYLSNNVRLEFNYGYGHLVFTCSN